LVVPLEFGHCGDTPTNCVATRTLPRKSGKRRTGSLPPFAPNVRAKAERQCYADHLRQVGKRTDDVLYGVRIQNSGNAQRHEAVVTEAVAHWEDEKCQA